jgi:hypothetical protein
MWLRNFMITDGSHPSYMDPDPTQNPSSTAPHPTTQQPWVVIRLLVRRFHCVNDTCPTVTFAEQVDGVSSPHARFTPLATRLRTSIAVMP